MKILRSGDAVPAALTGSILAIGNFDGVHRGHRAVLSREKELATSLGAPLGVMVFEPHPRRFFEPAKPMFRLTPLGFKLRLFEELGLDLAVVLDFDARLAGLQAHDFVSELLVDWLKIRHVVVGYDFFFGKGRAGSPQLMQRFGRELGFGVTIVEEAKDAEAAYSSTRVRQLLAAGRVEEAARILGYWWRVIGTVEGGAKRGTGLGFPTANLRLEPGQTLAHGIYAARVDVDGVRQDAAAYLGTRPTFDNGAPVLEVFLFDFDGDLYGKEIGVELIAWLRPDRAFEGIEALKAQMDEDCRQARQILGRAPQAGPVDLGLRLAQAPRINGASAG